MDRPRSALRERLKSLLVRTLYDCAIVGGKRSAAYVRRLGLWEHSVGGCYDVVDNEYFAREVPIARSTAPKDSRQHFLFVGRLAEEKNVAGLIRAYRLYRDAGGQWGLVLVGQGPLGEDLRVLTAVLGLTSDVKFEGHKDIGSLVPYYAHATAFVLPSTSEPWGLVVNEAMASGLPVIVSSRCGCVDDLVKDGENGYITDVDIEQLAGSMLRMSTLTDDERQAMGRRSLHIIASYSPSGFAAEVMRLVGQRG
jgi:glycosyltransferase involved in cell wall biosynthesis